ncbi:MAG: NTP transferase domain-containing protein [Saprospiraceae bacterium]
MIVAIILAAGTSTRMGETNKLLLTYQGQTLVQRIHKVVEQIAFETVITVLGHEAKQVKKVLQSSKTQFVFNPDFAQGMTSSIQAGIRACPPDTTGFMIFLSDLVLLQANTIQQLFETFEVQYHPEQALILLPTYQGKRGHPICFSAHFKTDILAHQIPHGCKDLVRIHANHVMELPVENISILRDVDTPEDFKQLPNT